MNMNHPFRVMLPVAGFCVAFAVLAQTQPNQSGQSQSNQSNTNQAQPQAAPPNQVPSQPNQPTVLGGPNNSNQVDQLKLQQRQQAIQMIEQGLNQLRQAQ